MSSSTLWAKDQLAEVFAAVCGTAADFGGWTPEVETIMIRLCQALDITPKLPALSVWTVKAPDVSALDERVVALERENLVLREDLGKARLDARTALSELEKRRAEDAARFQQKIDALNAELAAEREKQARRNQNLWLAIGIVAIGVIAAN